MRLPLDADGVPIRIGDEMNIDGDAMTVLVYAVKAFAWAVGITPA